MEDKSQGVRGRVLSGIQPTGQLHLGNYLGALRNWQELQLGYSCIYMVVDLHAVSLPQEAEELRKNSIRAVATLLALGIDTNKHILFMQSHNPYHSELNWLLECVARLGWLNRMTQYKEKSRLAKEGSSVALYTYPVLMASDILIYKATHVPVGDDQRQHLELCREIGSRFNVVYGVEYFPLPEAIVPKGVSRVMSLRDGKTKMSKSESNDDSRINLHDSEDEIVRKIKRAKTDSHSIPYKEEELEGREEARNLLSIYASLKGEGLGEVLQAYGGGRFSVLKEELSDLLVEKLVPLNRDIVRILNDDMKHLDTCLREGRERACALASVTLREVKDIFGFYSLR